MGLTTAPALGRHVELPHPLRRWRTAGSTERLAAVGAVGFLVFLAAGMMALALDGVSGSPAAGATDREIAEFFADHRFAHLVNMHLASAAILVLLPLFAVAASRVLRRAEPQSGDHVASTIVLAAGVVAVVPAFVQAVAWSAAAYHVAGDSAVTTRGLYDLGNLGFALMAYPLALLMLAMSAGARGSGLVGRGLTRVGVVLAVFVALSAIPLGTVALGFGAFVIWSVAVSWTLLGHPAPSSSIDHRSGRPVVGRAVTPGEPATGLR